MVSLASTVMLALLMDRVIDLDWQKNHFCGATYPELFQPNPQDDLEHGYRLGLIIIKKCISKNMHAHSDFKYKGLSYTISMKRNLPGTS